MSRHAWSRVTEAETELERVTAALDAARAALAAVRDAHARWARCETTATQFGDAVATALEATP